MPQPDTAPAGVIHDIGYRKYGGRRDGRAEVARALFTFSLRGVFGLGRSVRSKVLPFGVAIVMVLPALVIATISVVGSNQGLISEPVLPYSRYAIVLQAALAIFVATQAPQTVSLDLRLSVLPLYLSRPLERIDYVRAKFAALATAVFVVIAVPIMVLYVGSLAAGFDASEHTADAAAALVGAALFALVLSGIGLVISSLTPRRGFGIAAIITVLVLSYSTVTSLQGVIGHAEDDPGMAGWMGLFSPQTLVDGVQVWVFGAEASGPAEPTSSAAGATFVAMTLALIAACYLMLRRRYAKVRL